MIVTQVDEAQQALRDLIGSAGSTVAFTGAGLSTESGVPDYRTKDSPWLRYKPIAFSAFQSDVLMREEAWRRKFAMDDIYAGAKPSRGHKALARLLAQDRLDTIITQNIDNLHQASGVPDARIVELHGNGTYATCLACGHRHELVDVRRDFEATGAAPLCIACEGIVKSATVAFGQAMPVPAMARAKAASLGCDLFLAIGSSLVVYPAAAFPLVAQEAGARLVILNREPTPHDEVADLVLRGDIGDILEPFTV